MKRQAQRIIYLVLLVVFVVGITGIVRQKLGEVEAQKAQSAAQELVTETVEETNMKETEPETTPEETTETEETEPYYSDAHAEELIQMNIMELREQNPDIIGWISIPDTKLSYPLLQGEDNDYYLDHTWEMEESVAGSVL